MHASPSTSLTPHPHPAHFPPLHPYLPTHYHLLPPPADKITGINTFYFGHGNSNYAKTCGEYSGYNGVVGPVTTHRGSYVDLTTVTGTTTLNILTEVCKIISIKQIIPDQTWYFAVYTDVPRGTAGYCAWHSAGSCSKGSSGVLIQIAFFWNLDNDYGCDPGDDKSITGHSQVGGWVGGAVQFSVLWAGWVFIFSSLFYCALVLISFPSKPPTCLFHIALSYCLCRPVLFCCSPLLLSLLSLTCCYARVLLPLQTCLVTSCPKRALTLSLSVQAPGTTQTGRRTVRAL